MIRKAYLEKLNARLASLVKKHGIGCSLVVEQGGEGVGLVEIPKEAHEKWHGKIDRLEDDFVEDEGIVEVQDENRGRKTLKRGHAARWLVFEVAEDMAYPSSADTSVTEAMQKRVFAAPPPSDYDVPDPKTGLYKIPPADEKAPDQIYLTLAYEPFDAIKRGEKKTEFRAYTPNYVRKLLANPPKTVKFQRGYGKGAEQMIFEVANVDLYDMKTRRSARPGSEPKDFRPTHIAIDLGGRADGNTKKVATPK